MNWIPNRRTRRVLALLLGLDLLMLGLALAAYWGIARGQPDSLEDAGLVLVPASGASQGQGLDDYWEAPSWTLTDHMGRQVSSEQFRDQVVLASFVYTNCGDICPTISARMQALQGRLREEGLLGTEVQLLSFTVDPKNDTPGVLRAYAERHDADPEAWRFLTGSEAKIEQLLVKGFRFGRQKVSLKQPTPHAHADGTSHYHKYDVMHSKRIALIDRQGRMRALYDGTELDIDRVVRDIRSLRP